MNISTHLPDQVRILEKTSGIIQVKLYESLNTFDVFVSLLSSTVWRSSMELARIWIEKVSPDDWRTYDIQAQDSSQLAIRKQEFQENILRNAAFLLYKFAKNPTIFQQLSTRLLVRESLIQDLSASDQDRILASELHTSFQTWQQILSVFALYEELEELLKISQPPHIKFDQE